MIFLLVVYGWCLRYVQDRMDNLWSEINGMEDYDEYQRRIQAATAAAAATAVDDEAQHEEPHQVYQFGLTIRLLACIILVGIGVSVCYAIWSTALHLAQIRPQLQQGREQLALIQQFLHERHQQQGQHQYWQRERQKQHEYDQQTEQRRQHQQQRTQRIQQLFEELFLLNTTTTTIVAAAIDPTTTGYG